MNLKELTKINDRIEKSVNEGILRILKNKYSTTKIKAIKDIKLKIAMAEALIKLFKKGYLSSEDKTSEDAISAEIAEKSVTAFELLLDDICKEDNIEDETEPKNTINIMNMLTKCITKDEDEDGGL